MKRVLVTGGAGFIGSHIVEKCLELGYATVVYDDLSSGHRSNLAGLEPDFFQVDVSQRLPQNGRFDIIFHQAAITDPRHGNDEETLRKNRDGFERILELASDSGAQVVYASTAGLYGNGPTPMREDQEKEIVTAYASSKWWMDQRAEALWGEMPLVGLRYFNVFGPRESGKGRPASMIYHLSKQIWEGKRPKLFKGGEQIRDHIYVKDCVAANWAALSAPSGVYNVGTGVGTSFNELVRVLLKLWGKKLEIEYIEMPYDPKTYQHHTLAETSHAMESLKFKSSYSLEEGIKDYIPYLIEEFEAGQVGWKRASV